MDAGAEGTPGTGQETTTQTVTFIRHTYTVKYAGDSYFADHIFHLSDKQKELAADYAENLALFFGGTDSGGVATAKVSDEVLAYEWRTFHYAARRDIKRQGTGQRPK